MREEPWVIPFRRLKDRIVQLNESHSQIKMQLDYLMRELERLKNKMENK